MRLRLTVPAWWPALFVLLFAAVGLGVSLRTSPLGDLGVEADFFAELAPAAQELAAGRFAVANHPFKGPLHAFVLVPVHAALEPLGVNWYRAAVVVSLAAAALGLLVIHRLTRRLAGVRAAVVVLILTAAIKVYFIHAHKASTDQLFVLLVMSAVAVLLTGPPRPATWALCGAAAGLAWLTRDHGIVVPVWAAAVLLLVDPDRLPWRRRALAAACVWAGFALVAAPWVIATRQQTGRWVASGNLQNIVDEFYAGAAAARIPADGFRTLGQMVSHDPLHFASHYLANLPRHLVQDLNQITGLTMGALALVALATLIWRRPDRRQTAFLLLGGMMFLALGAVFYRPRFSLVLVPVWALVLALGVERLPRWRTPVAVAVVALGLLLHAGHSRRAVAFYDRQQPRHLLAAIAGASTWSPAAEGGDQPVLMARKAHLAHYAHLAFVPYPQAAADPSALVDRARARGVRYLVVGVLERQMLPYAAQLGRLERLEGVEVAWRDRDTVIYRLRPLATGGS